LLTLGLSEIGCCVLGLSWFRGGDFPVPFGS
jgi:hypothetical protein